MIPRAILPLAAVTALLSTHSALAVDFFAEDFDGLTLGPVVTFLSEVREREAWTQTPPAGWIVDDSGVPTFGIPSSSAVEFEGWSFVDKAWWITTAGDQDRSQFVSARGVVAVADPDEWDDFGTPGPASRGPYNAKLKTPAIPIGGAAAGQLKAFFHSSWRPEGNQKATLTATYNDPAGTVVEALRYESVETSGFFQEDATNQAVTLDLMNPAGASTVQLEFRLFDAVNNWWWAFDNLSVFTGAAPAQDGVLRAIIDRDSRAVRVVNNTGATVDLRGYSITSSGGVFNEQAADYLSTSDSQWLRATRFGDVANDLSEVHLSSDPMTAGETIALGNVWNKYHRDLADVSFSYLVEGSDDPVVGILEFTGNGGESFPFLDLNFNGAVEIGDWDAFRTGFAQTLVGKNAQQRYALGDLDDDGLHTARDFISFERLYDQANGAGSFAAALSVPEPTGGALSLLAATCLLVGRRLRSGIAWVPGLAVAGALLTAGVAPAQLKLFVEDFDDLPLGAPVEEAAGSFGSSVVTRTAPAGWTIDNSGMPGLGNPATDGVVDWAGWSFARKDWWVEVAGDQDRGDFTLGTGNVMVADPDEWDDAANLDGVNDPINFYDTFIKTPEVNIPAGIPAGRIRLTFDSSWRDEAFDDRDLTNNQTATVRAIYNGGASSVQVLKWDSDPESLTFKNDAPNERVSLDLQYNGTSSKVQLEFGLGNAWNDWWWAVDNVQISVPADPAVLRVNTFNGQASLSGGDVIASPIKSIDITSANGVLTGAAAGLAANGGDSVDGPDADTVPGNTSGETWQRLDGSSNRLFEAFLFGASVYTESRTTSLGSLLNPTTPAGSRDIAFNYTNLDGDLIEGVVEYYFDNSAGVPGDANADGNVDLLDLDILGANFGAMGATLAQGDFNSDSKVDLLDLDILGANFGAGASVATAVPEPTGLGLMLLGLLGAIFGRRARAAIAASCVAASAALVSSASAFTLDRDYRFGGGANENAVAGGVVGAASINGATRDSAGLPGMNQIIDLLPKGNLFLLPNYVSVTDRPDGVSGLGIALNPLRLEEQYLQTGFGEALNFPERSPSSTLAVPAGSINYRVISDRGFQIWVKPTAINGRANIVMDSNQHGVFIDSAGRWSMRYADVDYSSSVSAATGQWAHLSVVRPFGPDKGSILYVNGVASAAATGQYKVERVVNLDNPNVELGNLDTSPLVIGSTTGKTASQIGASSFFSGVVDDLQMFVMGINSSQDLGEYVFERDDRYAARFKPLNTVDLTGDNLITLADATVFASNWRFEKALTWFNTLGGEQRLVVGDLTTRAKGDFNFDGRIDLADWGMLNSANSSAAAFAMQLIATGVPEPSAGLLIVIACVGELRRRG